MSAAAAYKPAHGGYPGTVQTGAVRDTGKRKAAAELHAILCKIASEGQVKDTGLCFLVELASSSTAFRRVRPLLREAMLAWPEHSGDPEYPVSDPSGLYRPSVAFVHLQRWGDTPYGRARRRLLWHCIDWCEAEMSE